MSAFKPESYGEALAVAQKRQIASVARRKAPEGRLTPSGTLKRSRGLTSKRPAGLQHRPAPKKRAKKVKRTKMPSRKSLIRRIDALVFQIICLMYVACVECGSVDKPTTGHVLSRRSYSTRWDFRNIFRQCWGCNYKAAMTAAASYHLWFVKKFGVEAFDQLYRDWTGGRKFTRLELIALATEYQIKLDSMRGTTE